MADHNLKIANACSAFPQNGVQSRMVTDFAEYDKSELVDYIRCVLADFADDVFRFDAPEIVSSADRGDLKALTLAVDALRIKLGDKG